MIFLLDHDVPDDVAYPLSTLGHAVVRLREVLPASATDSTVLAHALAHRWVVVTCNRDDFLYLAKARPHAGIVILIRRRSRAAERAALVRLIDKAGEMGIVNNINFA